MSNSHPEVKEYGYFADNTFRKAPGNKAFDVHEPYSGKLFGRVAAGTREDARFAVDAAARAFPAWAATTPADKVKLFLKAAEIVRRRKTEIAEVLARETGSTISFATFQQDLVAATLQQTERFRTGASSSRSIFNRVYINNRAVWLSSTI